VKKQNCTSIACVVEREQFLQLGDDHIVEAGDAAKGEEQAHHEQAQFGRIDVIVGRALGICCGRRSHGLSFLSRFCAGLAGRAGAAKRPRHGLTYAQVSAGAQPSPAEISYCNAFAFTR
jgi:hypothetical protein